MKKKKRRGGKVMKKKNLLSLAIVVIFKLSKLPLQHSATVGLLYTCSGVEHVHG